MIGVVIGKGGDMIKKIQQESGARIQFRPEDEQGGPSRMCNLTGTHEQTQAAANMIQDLIDSTAVCLLFVY
jgi:far upstream element-binding protein